MPAKLRILILILIALLPAWAGGAEPAAPGSAGLGDVVAEMQARETGPFVGVRWFCKDGSVLPPRPFACEGRGGGRQHGLWSEQTRSLRERGYLIGNVLAALEPGALAADDDAGLMLLTSVLLERFLIEQDDGWIWRRARFFRGVLQDDDERAAADAALRELIAEPQGLARRLLLVREAARLLPGEAGERELWQVRSQSNAIAEVWPAFAPQRNKLHTDLDPEDAGVVRALAEAQADPARRERLRTLAAAIDEIFQGGDTPQALRRFAAYNPAFAPVLKRLAGDLERAVEPERRLADTAEVLKLLRHAFLGDGTVTGRLEALRLGLRVEGVAFAAGRELRERAQGASRRRLLGWLRLTTRSLYSTGFLTGPELDAALAALEDLEGPNLDVEAYRRGLAVLERVNHWAARRLAFYFQPAIERLRQLDPLTAEYIPDRLRGSPLLLHAELVTLLQADGQVLAGVENRLFGEPAAGGLQALNPGLAQGRLVASEQLTGLGDERAIVMTDETTAELPAVAGIVTAESGNGLSHVQLLARNLGIPNVVVSGPVLAALRAHRGSPLFLAVSPGGVVQIDHADERSAQLVRDNRAAAPVALNPDVARLALEDRSLPALSALRAQDSGRRVGPKAANLGELARRFPGRVSAGLAIPFGHFRAVLEQPYFGGGGHTMAAWLQGQYTALARLEPGAAREARLVEVLGRVREWFQHVRLPEAFVRQLRARMAEEFGPAGSYGVFVRSDTNIEDLPNFSGAGLNRTVPHVVGFEATLEAIRAVWASVFTERAWGWRQAMVPDPMQVYAAVLLHRSVPVEVSGVLLTADMEDPAADVFTVAVNEGPGGGVSGQAAESLRIHRADGRVDWLSSATEPYRVVLADGGGVERVRASGAERLLGPEQRRQLLALDREIHARAGDLLTAAGERRPADVEFGFHNGELVLFQIRPLADDPRARSDRYLATLDAPLEASAGRPVDLDRAMAGGGR